METDINRTPFSYNNSYSGTCIDEQGNEFGFIIGTLGSDIQEEYITDISWTNEQPENTEEAENDIRQNFDLWAATRA